MIHIWIYLSLKLHIIIFFVRYVKVFTLADGFADEWRYFLVSHSVAISPYPNLSFLLIPDSLLTHHQSILLA